MKTSARLSKKVAALVALERVSRVATSGAESMPHVVPVCHVLHGGKIWFASGDDGRKILNLRENPRAALTIDVYSEHWPGLKGVLIQGRARLHTRGAGFRRIRALLYRKYPQYAREAALDPSDSVIVEVTPTRVFTWGLD